MNKFFQLLILACLAVPLYALDLPKAPQGRVNDHAGMITSSMEEVLENLLEDHEQDTSNQIVVATFPSLEGNSIEDVSYRLATQWKLGQKDKNNGVLLIVFRNERKLRIEVGYGLEASLTDAKCRMIIENEIKPFFKSGNYDEGINSGVHAIIAVIRNEYQPSSAASPNSSMFPVIIFILFFILLALFGSQKQTCYESSGWSNSSRSSGWGSSSSGWGSSSSGWSSRSGSSFSGGGGRFGGGGASGSW